MTRIMLTTMSNLTDEQIRQLTEQVETEVFDLDGEAVDLRLERTEIWPQAPTSLPRAKSVNHRCKCSCGKYETIFELPIGVATSAALMHCMLDGSHKVIIENTDKRVIATVTRNNCTYHTSEVSL